MSVISTKNLANHLLINKSKKEYMNKKSFVSLFFILLLLLPFSHVFAWQVERPSNDIDFYEERIENCKCDEEVSVGIGVDIHKYVENDTWAPFNDRDGFIIRVVGTANARKGIYYDWDWQNPIPLGPIFENTLNLGDDNGDWVDLSYIGKVAFYSGPGLQNSSLYEKVWVCSNGFLCFEGEYTNPTPQSIPNPEKPNTIIAPYWSDLDPAGGTISWGKYIYFGQSYIAIGWHNVLDKANNKRQSFAVFIKQRGINFPRAQNLIILQYYNVEWSGFALYGIEDQEGYKGNGCYPSNGEMWVNKAIRFECFRQSPQIKEMTIKLEKQDTEAEILTDMNNWSLQSYNLLWESQVTPPSPELAIYGKALKGGLTLLISKYVIPTLGLPPVAGWMFGIALIGVDIAPHVAELLWPTSRDLKIIKVKNANTTENLAYLTVPAAGSNEWEWPVDTLIGAQFFWIFNDTNVKSHQLKISIEAIYYSYQLQSNATISTSVDLNVICDAGNRISEARHVTSGEYLAYLHYYYDADDYYNISVSYNQYIEITMCPSDNVNFDLYLYNREGKLVAYSNRTNDNIEDITYRALYTGNYSIRVNAPYPSSWLGEGLYKLKIEVSDSPPGGGCPFVYVWNGTQYIIDNNLLAASEVSNGQDVEDYYKLEQLLVPKYEGKLLSWYSLQIGEFENEHTYIDQIKLFAADHTSDVKVAVTSNGEILTYKNPYSPILAIDNDGNDVLEIVKTADNQCYQGNNGTYLLINFGNIDITNGAKLILRANQELIPKSPCIKIQIQDLTGSWVDIETIQTRVNMSTQIINLPKDLPDVNGELKIRLYFTTKHKIDYVGLDASPQTNITIHQCIMVSAIHSEKGSILNELLFKDQVYAELLPTQQIKLTFTTLRTTEKRTFILYINGHYYTLKP